MDSVTGTLAYRERIALPDNAVVTVTLQDISLADAPAKVIANIASKRSCASTFEFDLAYDTNKIEARHRYSVSARIEVDGKLRFITDTSYPVITDNAQTDNVNLRLIAWVTKYPMAAFKAAIDINSTFLEQLALIPSANNLVLCLTKSWPFSEIFP